MDVQPTMEFSHFIFRWDLVPKHVLNDMQGRMRSGFNVEESWMITIVTHNKLHTDFWSH